LGCAPWRGTTSTAHCASVRFCRSYNFIGFYLTQQQDFDNAYDAFDSRWSSLPITITLPQPGIASLRQRPSWRWEDLSEFYRRRPEDPYRESVYMAEHQVDAQQATGAQRVISSIRG
jgi:lipoprotein NlpI